MQSNLKPSFKRTTTNIQPNGTTTTTTTTITCKSQRQRTMKLPKTSSVNLTSQPEARPTAANNTNGGQEKFIVNRSCSSSFRYKNILASRSVPILFILVCFLVIANTNCDHAGSTNVQKFHPNGRYGRRSVDNFAEQHDELGKLVLDDQSDSSRASGLPPMKNIVSNGDGNSLIAMLRTISRDANEANAHLNQNANKNSNSIGRRLKQAQFAEALVAAGKHLPTYEYDPMNSAAPHGGQLNNYQLEMNKLLRCNYLGISNFYKCESASASVEAS